VTANLKIPRPDAHPDPPAWRLTAPRPDLFARQGHVAATWRRRNGKMFGPYYQLRYRQDGRQRAVYLGRDGQLVQRVRQELQKHQTPSAERRTLNRLERQIRRSLRVQKLTLAALLRPLGLRLKGTEVRGWRFAPIRFLLPRRRRLMPRISRRKPRPKRHRPILRDPRERLLRFLDARDALARKPAAMLHPH
jgi:hypothetical protein